MDHSTAESAATAAAMAFIDAFNAQDIEGLADTLNYPHVRLANGAFATVPDREEFIRRSERGREALLTEGWHHTVVESVSVIQSGAEKVHLKLLISRCRADNSVYNQFDTLWIATLQGSHWGIQFRSSYLR